MTPPGTPQPGAQRAANLSCALTTAARRLPDATAVVHGDTRWTWSELDARVSALAAAMADRGVGPGDCVMLDGPNHPEFIQAMFATWRLGAVLAPVNARLHDSDIAAIAGVCKPVLMVAHTSTSSHVTAVHTAVGGLNGTFWLDQDGTDSVRSCTATTPVGDSPVRVGSAAWYFFTSGT
ncbi:MAG TPA: AMP-binding protein, partial [Pseudonocardiaceae bacterium]|nr:AMP-binding protein [Pseudonocardiaceae bacterium]